MFRIRLRRGARAEPLEAESMMGKINGSHYNMAGNIINQAICSPNHPHVNECWKSSSATTTRQLRPHRNGSTM